MLNQLAAEARLRLTSRWVERNLGPATSVYEVDSRVDQSQLLKGTTRLLILSVLRDAELHGYEIRQQISERSGAAIEPGEGWLYPALHRLEAEGAIEANWRAGSLGPRRRYYRITQAGQALLAELEADWASFSASVRLVTSARAG